MEGEFFQVKARERVWAEFDRFAPLPVEEIPLELAVNRVLADSEVAPEDLPLFGRSTVDGYAVRARDTFGASESLPSFLELGGEVVMGEDPGFDLVPGQAARIPTGGMLPGGSDSVVMLEYTEALDQNSIAVHRSVAPLENVIRAGDDFRAGEEVISAGRRLRPQEIGLLAAFGQTRVRVRRRPEVAIISSGDEIVPPEQQPAPGQLRDVNSYSLAALVRQWGGKPRLLGVARDRFSELQQRCRQALDSSDLCLISGGSSVGSRDLTLEVLSSFKDSEVLAHGVAISPGKPTILVRVGRKACWGLPGHVASAMVVFYVLVRPFLDYLSGIRPALTWQPPLPARLERNLASKQGREDFVRVRVRPGQSGLTAEPVFGQSGLISTLVRADGLLRIPRQVEGLYAGERVEVLQI